LTRWPSVHHQFQSLLDVSTDACHDPLGRLGRPHEDVAVVGEPAKFKTTPLQLLIQLVEDDVAEQGTERTALNGSFRGGGHQAVGHDAAAQDQPDQTQDARVGDGLSQAGDQPVMVDSVEEFR
jgi:hypothetical protein